MRRWSSFCVCDIMGDMILAIEIIGCVVFVAFSAGLLHGSFTTPKIPDPPKFEPLDTYYRKWHSIVLIASRNGEKTIGDVVRAARNNGWKVCVVDDCSSDRTSVVAREAGAFVLTLETNVGKPAALKEAYFHFKLSLWETVTILDDDVLIEPDFITEALKKMDDNTAVVVGHNDTLWPKEKRWNVWLASRSYAYWYYQLVIRRVQSALGVMNCISGSHSVYRTKFLTEVLPVPPPYIVDDTYWCMEAQRRKLGKVVYAPRAKAHLQDPTNFPDWYKQNLRWMWGTLQGIIGHKVGTKATLFDFAYVILIFQWLLYVLSGPATFVILLVTPLRSLGWFLLLGYGVWLGIASISLKIPRLILFLPAIVVVDFIYRVVMVHGLVKALRQPTVDRCVWESPVRMATATRGE